MDFFEVLKERRSVRAFKPDPVSEDDLRAILDAVNAAPSAGNLQAYEVVLVKDGKTREKLAEAAWGQEFIAQAPLCLVFLANPRRSEGRYGARGRRLYCVQDATIAACHAHLACAALGLASVWVGAFSDEGVSEAVCAGADLLPVCVLPIGYAAERPEPRQRRSLTDLVHQERVRDG